MSDPESILTQLGQLIDSQEFAAVDKLLDHLTSQEPPTYEWWYSFGKQCTQSKQQLLALKAFNQCLKLNPQYVPAYLELVDIFINNEDYDKAEKSLIIANQFIPNHGLIEGKLGQVYLKSGDYESCVRWTTLAIQHEPKVPDLYNILGDSQLRLGQLDEAKIILERGLTLAPNFPRLLNTYASVYALEGKYERSIEILNRAIAIDPDFAQAHVKKGVNLLTIGQLSSGWREYEYRFQLSSVRNPKQNSPRWVGEGLKGRSILIWTEQGLGDTIQYFRYIYNLKALGAQVIFECRPIIHPLFVGHPILDHVLCRHETRPKHDFHISVMSLPMHFEKTLQDRRAPTPYLFPNVTPSSELEQFVEELKSVSKLKVGLTWAGNPDNKNDRNRSIQVETFIPLLGMNDVQFINMQFGVLNLPPEIKRLPNPTPFISNFAETALVLNQLDLVLTVDTSMCHLAGALGRPVWTLLPFNPDFRWGLGTDKTDYYSTMRLFRQSVRNDWESVIKRVSDQLISLVNLKR